MVTSHNRCLVIQLPSSSRNHEFDYGIDQLKLLEEKANFDFLSCNLVYEGKKENKLANVKPYKIFEFGKKKVAVIGVSTPLTHISSTPKNFMEDGEYVYNFTADTKEEFYDCVQTNIDECDNLDCDFIILSTHLGHSTNYSPYSVSDLVNNISGCDCVLDGHAHYDIENTTIKDEDGNNIPLLDSGTKLNKFGHVNIKNGKITTKLVKEYDKKNATIDTYINNVKTKIEQITSRVVCHSDCNLSIFDEDGIRMVRTRELPISNLCADAMRIVSDAEIGFVNGGGVRTNLKSGDITYGDIINVHPYGNECSVIKATGKNILDHLEYTTYKTKAEYKTTNDLGVMVPNGEFGGFPCVSGIKFDLDVTKESKVKLDADGLFDKVDGDYRVSNVKVLKDGEYVDIEMNTYYTVATTNYIAFENGDGGTVFKECEKVTSGQIDYQNLIDYIVSLDGKLKDKYSTPEGRINIIS